MLTELMQEHEDLVQPEQSIRFEDLAVDEKRVRRVTFYWYAQGPRSYGPNGFTADQRVGQTSWLVRAISGLAAVTLLPGDQVDERELVRTARVIFNAASTGWEGCIRA